MKKVEEEKKQEEVKSKSKVKQYLLLILIFVFIMGLVLYLCRWYKVYDDYKKETPVIRGILSEIINEDLEHYIADNSNTIIYLCTSREDSCRNFEKDFKKFVVKYEYTDDIVYLNLTDVDQDKFVEEFNNTYNYKIKLNTNYPAIVVFEEGKVSAILQGDDNKKITVSTVKDFLNFYKIGE